jgi:cellulose synthase/poly-beta-1,6-N-acetylglucosamine synthase-like glycosyltransferase
MKWVFWASVGLIGYTYLGYPAWLWVRCRLRSMPVRKTAHLPSVSVAMVVRDEARGLKGKLDNLAALNYPADRFEMVVLSDGSTDETEAILAERARDSRFRIVISLEPRGKAAGLNDVLRVARGEVVVFTDARQSIEPDAVRRLVENFADPMVGCASGELMLGDPQAGETGKGMGLYWRIEKKIREWEAASGSAVGATGALYAARRELLVKLPEDTILDDVFLPMHVARQGARVIFDETARAWDRPNLGAGREFRRKVRTLSGNYQLLQIAPWLLTRANPIRFEFVSHKVLRLVVPFALVAALVTSIFVPGSFYRAALAAQLAFYGLSGVTVFHLKLGPVTRLADAAFTFVALNTAALVAFGNFVTGRKTVWLSSQAQQKSTVGC